MIGDRLAEEKERLEEVVANKGYLLVERRDRGLEDAINLEASENFHCLGVFVSWEWAWLMRPD